MCVIFWIPPRTNELYNDLTWVRQKGKRIEIYQNANVWSCLLGNCPVLYEHDWIEKYEKTYVIFGETFSFVAGTISIL